MPWRPQPGLQVDSAKCLDRIPPAALRAKTPAAPASRWQRKAWLPAGVLEDGHVAPTAAGTPPGGTISLSSVGFSLMPLWEVVGKHRADRQSSRDCSATVLGGYTPLAGAALDRAQPE